MNIRGITLNFNEPKVMGILNITPDSFYKGSRSQTDSEILSACEKMLSEGADIIDIGSYSSRPGATDISPEEEWNRTKKALAVIRNKFPDIIISLDTFRASVAENALMEGADMINDISAGMLDGKMFGVIAKYKCPYIMMHMKGTPQNMINMNQYDNLIKEIIEYFQTKIIALKKLEVNNIIIDPGFGFAKNVEQNFELLAGMRKLEVLGFPILAGLSRKSMIYKTLGIEAEQALNGTTALNMLALINGASILRVHDVKEAKECIKLFYKLPEAN